MIGYIKMDLGIAKYRFEIGTEEINNYLRTGILSLENNSLP